jgi:hypothetical protein
MSMVPITKNLLNLYVVLFFCVNPLAHLFPFFPLLLLYNSQAHYFQLSLPLWELLMPIFERHPKLRLATLQINY